MPTNLQNRHSLKELIDKHLKERDPDYELLLEIIQDPSRQIPIKAVLEGIRRFNHVKFTPQELELIDNLLYMYG